MTNNEQRSRDPLDGVTLAQLLTRLEAHYGWAALGALIDIRCFKQDPSISSSLKFLRRTPWARAKVEDLYRRLIISGQLSNED
ncbi:MAG TPA: VF530 family protein [Cellvibrionaceae bacterium]